MSQSPKILYSPALRMKAGELEGMRQLADDVAERVLPRLIVPPKSERDTSTPLLLDLTEMPDIGPALAPSWRNRPALIDATYLIDEYGRDRMTSWLPQMFERSRDRGAQTVPLALLSDIGSEEAAAFRAAINRDGPIQFAVSVPVGEMVGPEFFGAMREALDRLALTPENCVVIADFEGSDFSNPEIVAPIIGGALETLQELGMWRLVTFQGTSYPETNTVKAGAHEFWPRNEWLAWRRAVKFDPSTADHMIFGDYAADSAKMVFGGSGGKAIRHLRYTAGPRWLVQRGTAGLDFQVMKAVCKAIVDSGHFAGAEFSRADAYIHRTALGQDGPGNSTIWRQLNTTHHITQVVADIASVRGVQIKRKPAEAALQLALSV